jgi:hypothetical protein
VELKDRSDAALRVLEAANGVARAHVPSFKPVELKGQFEDDNGHSFGGIGRAAGHWGFRGYASGKAAIGTATHLPPQSPRAAELVALRTKSPSVEEVLALLAKDDLTLYDLHKICEIITDEVGRDNLTRAGWTTRAELRRFGLAANHQAVSGSAARHARMRGQPTPERHMSLPDAAAFTSGLVKSWLDSLADPRG